MENQSDLNPERETLINTFCEITSSTNPEALFYLESHNFDLDSAVSTFFETNPAVPSADVPAPASAAAANAHSPADSQSYSPSQSESSSPPRSRSPSPRRRSKQPQTSGAYNLRSAKHGNASAPGASGAGRRSAGIHTFADLNRRTAAGSGSDSDEPQEYYTGGEKSLNMVGNIVKPCSSSRAEGLEAERGGAGGVEHIRRNSKFVCHVNHGRGKHLDYESAQAYSTDGFLNAFSDSRFSPFRAGVGLGLEERGDFEVQRWCQDEDGDGDMVVSVNKDLCDFNCG
nr:plant UBX domain-containing protein 4-like [Ipomoea batatas]